MQVQEASKLYWDGSIEVIPTQIQMLQVCEACKRCWDGPIEVILAQVQMLQLGEKSKLRSYGARDACLVEAELNDLTKIRVMKTYLTMLQEQSHHHSGLAQSAAA